MRESRAQIELPPEHKHIIERPRLLKLLDETQARIILLVAPAGYGKTTLARQWLARRTGPIVWVKSPRDARTAMGLGIAIASAASAASPECGTRLRQRLRARGPHVEFDSAVRLLIEDLTPMAQDLLVAIDDLHVVSEDSLEQLFDAICDAGARIVAASRTAPTFLTSRRLVYGEAMIIGPEALTMTATEVKRVLDEHHHESISTILDEARGWPAVVGLAALTQEGRKTGTIGEPLYDFFAAEVVAQLPASLRDAILDIAIYPRFEASVVQSLNAEAQAAISGAAARGLLTPDAAGTLEFHPLFRSYLLEQLSPSARRSRAAVAAALALDVAAIDTAFEIVRDDVLVELIPRVIECGLEDALAEGRVDRVEEWLALAQGAHPLFDLAEAELAFREGRLEHAERVAAEAARQLGGDHVLASRAYAVAGRAAHLRDRSDEAEKHFTKAREVSKRFEDTRAAVWGLFAIALDRETFSSDGLYDDVLELGDTTMSTRARLHVARHVDVRSGLAHTRTLQRIVRDLSDPVERAASLNLLANNLIVAGFYAEALEVIAEQAQEADSFGLDFVAEHLERNRAAAYVGVRRLDEAAHALRRLGHPDTLSPWLGLDSRCIAARLAVARGDLELAWMMVRVPPPEGLAAAMRGEFLALAGFVAATVGEIAQAEALSGEAEDASGYVDVRVLVPLTRLLTAPTAAARVRAADLARASYRATGAADALVTAVRASDQVLVALTGDPTFVDDLRPVLERSNDGLLASSAGIVLPSTPSTSAPAVLTPREREVLGLLTQGLKNREIAQALFIAEVTVKVHVRHIFEKLGVRTRTEAVLAASRQGEDH